MSLAPCREIYGGTAVIPQPPSITIAHGARLLPRSIYKDKFGLYYPSGRAVPEGLTFRGVPEPHTPLTPLYTAVPDTGFPVIKDDYHYVYMGPIARHYGHFLIGSVARLWNLPVHGRDRLRLVYSNDDENIDYLLKMDFVIKIFTSLNIKRENFISFNKCVVFDKIEVPALAFEENSHVHQAYSDLMRHIGQIISPPSRTKIPGRIVYLSKERVTYGVTRISNEHEITAELKKSGIEVVFPETLPLKEQIDLWRTSQLVIGVAGSVLHTSAFAQPSRIMCLNRGPTLWSNQVLIDRVSGNLSEYFYPESGVSPKGKGDGFHMSYYVDDPVGIARDIVQRIHQTISA